MGEKENLQVAERLWEALNEQNVDATEELYHEDCVIEWPQSGERIVGRDNILAINRNYPGLPKATLRNNLAAGDWVIAEVTLDYGGDLFNAVSIYEIRDGKIVKETDYFASPFEAPEWRSQWVEKM
jgi:hypothetical protein